MRGNLKLFHLRRHYRKSYSQCGEDVIVDRILSLMGIKNPTYLDIGANDPIFRNNTYFLYEKGFSRVNIEQIQLFLKSSNQNDIET